MKYTFVLLAVLSATSALASATNALPNGNLTCNERIRGNDAGFSEMTASFSGKSVSIQVKLSAQTLQSIEKDATMWQKVLDGTAIGGGKPTDEEMAQARKSVDQDHAILNSEDSTLTLQGSFEPYVRASKGNLIRYSLEVTSPGVDSDTLWGFTGNEGMSGILRLDPSDLNNSVEIYTAGGQGGTYDHFDCVQE